MLKKTVWCKLLWERVLSCFFTENPLGEDSKETSLASLFGLLRASCCKNLPSQQRRGGCHPSRSSRFWLFRSTVMSQARASLDSNTDPKTDQYPSKTAQYAFTPRLPKLTLAIGIWCPRNSGDIAFLRYDRSVEIYIGVLQKVCLKLSFTVRVIAVSVSTPL